MKSTLSAENRREALRAALYAATAPVSASVLAARFSVSRQVIVGDIALLRAEGRQIAATPRGYVITQSGGLTVQLAVCHSGAETRAELYAMVDCGCTVLDVVVEHPVYGQLTAALQLSSRYDVDQFMIRMADNDARPLSLLTEGIHLHTVSCPTADAMRHMKAQLRAMGVLLEEN